MKNSRSRKAASKRTAIVQAPLARSPRATLDAAPDGYSEWIRDLTSDGQIVVGDFSYGTTVESGKVTFSIAVKDGLLNTLASGSSDGMILAGPDGIGAGYP